MSQLVQNLLVGAAVIVALAYLVRQSLRRRSGRHACAACAARPRVNPRKPTGSR